MGDSLNRPLAAPLLLAAGLIILTALALRTDRPPDPLPADAPEVAFSAMRARQTLRDITQAPHRVGSAEHARVRERLVESLRALGLEPEVQHTTAVSPYVVGYAADVHNVVARLPGTASSGALVLLAHYDSVPGSYGASDDGAGVAAILETVRALQSGTPLRNDVIVLFSDAEEIGLLGATAFVQEHPSFPDVAVVVNVEARGSHGAALMYQTIGPNGRLIQALASTSQPVANTVMQEVYERLPNGTDLSAFVGTGTAGMDIAYIRGLAHYHTPLDDYAQQSPASLQHHGTYLLGLASTLGHEDLGEVEAPEQTYFNVGTVAFARYPESWTLPLALFAAVLVNGLLAYGLTRGLLRGVPVLVGLLAATVTVGGAALLGQVGWNQLAARSTAVLWNPYRLFYDSTPYFLAFCALALALSSAVSWLAQRWATAVELVAAPLVVWSLAGVASALYVPGAGYLFIWPTLATVVAAVLLVKRPEEVTPSTAAALALLAAPAILLVVPWVEWLEVAMTMRAVAASLGLLAFVALLLAAQMAALVRGLGVVVPVALLFLSLGSATWGALTPEYDATHKRPDNIDYAADRDTGEAYWVSSDPETDEWTRQFLGDQPERGALPALGLPTVWHSPAPLLALEEPAVTLVGEATTEDVRQLTLRVQPPPGTFRTVVESMPGGAAISECVLDDRWPLGPSAATDQPERILTFMGAPADGFTVTLTVPADGTLVLRLRTTRPGLPLVPERPRAEDTMSRGDATVTQRSVVFPPT